MKVSIGGAFTLLWIPLTAFCSITPFSGLLPLAILSPSLFRAAIDYLQFWYCSGVFLFILNGIHGSEYEITGDVIPADAAVILMANHRTRCDWMYIFFLVRQHGCLGTLKIMAKKSLAAAPWCGWGMQLFGYLFLHRDLKRDESHIRRVMRRYLQADYPVKLLLFPEGSDLSDSNIELSHDFSNKRDLPVFDHLLHPRTHGLRLCLEEMAAEASQPRYVMDVTIAYSGYIPATEAGLLLGKGPSTVHIHCKLFPLTDVPSNDEVALKAWLYERWVEKEAMLKTFYEDEAAAKREGARLGGGRFVAQKLAPVYVWPTLVLWLVACGACLYSLYAFAAWRLFFVIASLAMFCLTANGGIEQVELASALGRSSGRSTSKKHD